MKQAIAIAILLGMFGWTIYNFIQSQSNEDASIQEQETPQIEEENEIKQEIEEEHSQPAGLNIGDKAPDFELNSIEGDSVKLSDYKGKKVFLNFWATWCPPCRVEMPSFQELHDTEDVVVLGINLTKEEVGVDFIQGFLDHYDLSFPVLLDEDLKVAKQYAIKPIPTTYMIDSNGVIHDIAYGPLNHDLMVEGIEQMK